MPSKAPPTATATDPTDASKEKDLSPGEISAAVRQFLHSSASLPRLQSAPSHPVLPVSDKRNILITSALPYVNNVPHLGNITSSVLSADVFARFCRLRGHNTLYVCGTDEYGTTTETKALQEGISPKEICDKYHRLHKEIYDWFELGFDYFGRTTTPEQTKVAQDIFWDLHKAGNLVENNVDQLYCAKCTKFLADRFVEGVCPLCGFDDARGDQCDGCGKLINAIDLIKPKCKVCSDGPEVRTSRHIFLNLEKLEPELKVWMDKACPDWTLNARGIAKTWVKGGLLPRCITRDLKWGTPVPLKGYEDKVFYVWFDAPIGYVSMTACYTPKWELWWRNPENVEYFEFMGKDNVPFHSVVFPACQLGTKKPWTMVNRLMATEYLNYEDAKFSKSRGIGVFGNDARDSGLPSDIWRFYLVYMRPESQDSAFQWDDLMLKVNSELLGNLGNFVNRALKFCKENFGGVVASIQLSADGDQQLLAQINRCLAKFVDLMENARMREGLTQLLSISRLGNQYMQTNKPWKLVKSADEVDRERAASVIALSVNIACLLSVIMEPFMPTLSRTLQSQLNIRKENLPSLTPEFRCLAKPGHVIGSPAPMIKEIKPEEIKSYKERFAGQQEVKEVAKDKKAAPVAGGVDPVRAKELDAAVAKQGDAVRALKDAKADKDQIKAEVGKLLELKKQLAVAKGETPVATPAAAKGKKKGKK